MRHLLPRIEAVPFWPTIAAPVFCLLFIGIVWWTFKGSRKSTYHEVEQLPLDD